jgi:hypothetical protein
MYTKRDAVLLTERGRETNFVERQFMLVLPTFIILMEWVVYVLLCKAKELPENFQSSRMESQWMN